MYVVYKQKRNKARFISDLVIILTTLILGGIMGAYIAFHVIADYLDITTEAEPYMVSDKPEQSLK